MKREMARRIDKLEDKAGGLLASLRGRPVESLTDGELCRIIDASLGLEPRIAAMTDEELCRVAEEVSDEE
jgi:hypothetical protein